MDNKHSSDDVWEGEDEPMEVSNAKRWELFWLTAKIPIRHNWAPIRMTQSAAGELELTREVEVKQVQSLFTKRLMLKSS